VDRGLRQLVQRLDDWQTANAPLVAAQRREARNIACLRTVFDALSRADFEPAFAHLTHDTSYSLYAAGQISFQLAGDGLEAVREGMRTNFAAVEFERIDIDTLVAQDDAVMIVARQRGRWRESGVAFDERIILEYLFRDAQVARYRGWILPFAA